MTAKKKPAPTPEPGDEPQQILSNPVKSFRMTDAGISDLAELEELLRGKSKREIIEIALRDMLREEKAKREKPK